MSYASIDQRLQSGGTVILDGGTGTELEHRGAAMNPDAWCGAATLDNLELLKTIHRDYIAAGAHVITANTYASSRVMLRAAGLEKHFGDLNRSAVGAALEARESSGVSGVAVAGSLSHMVPIVSGEAHADRSRTPSNGQLADAFGELAHLHKDEGCDLIILEMMFHPERMPLAFEAAIATGLPVWAGLSARRGHGGEVLSFTTEADIAFDEITELAAGYEVAAAGVMHTQADVSGDAIDIVANHFDIPLMAYPDSGYFAMPEWQFEEIIPPAELHEFAKGWRDRGVQILGGCCGLSPRHIEALTPLA